MEYSPDEAKVLRDGRAQKIHAVELVPGDVITLAVGDKVPADSRVVSISSASFTIDQALLTGESYSVSKSTAVVKDDHAVKQDMTNMLFSVRRILALSRLLHASRLTCSLTYRARPSLPAKRRRSSWRPEPRLPSATFTPRSAPRSAKKRR